MTTIRVSRRWLMPWRGIGRLALLLGLACIRLSAPAVVWVRAGLNTNEPIWGIQGGLLWALPPGGFPSPGGPRGLIRLGYPILTNGGYSLINFIAVEPVVNGHRGFSELEPSGLDHVQGKRFWAVGKTNILANSPAPVLVPGELSQPAAGVDQLEVAVGLEPFENGARVRLGISQRSDAPDELRLAIYTEPGSAPLDYCILTATMGNFARTRRLWLKNQVVRTQKLYPNFTGKDFAPHRIFPLAALGLTQNSDRLAAVTTDEDEPARVFPFPGTQHWYYGGDKVTQYWKQPHGEVRGELQVAVNARFTYWQSRQPIPGGVAFENFELRERFYQGQSFVFGITRKTPGQLGLGK